MKISRIYVYPIKSLRGTELPNAVLGKHGVPYDRHFMLLRVQDDGGQANMQVSKVTEMCLFTVAVDPVDMQSPAEPTMTITYYSPDGQTSTLTLPLEPDVDNLEDVVVTMYKSPAQGYNMGNKANEWFSERFGYKVILAYIGNNTREVLMSTRATTTSEQNGGSWLSSITKALPKSIGGLWDEANESIKFSDVAPYLIVSEASLDEVSSRLPDGEKMDMTKFRPNIVISGADEPWEEDYWGALTLGDASLRLIHNCARCASINVDYSTGRPGKGEAGQVLKKLQSNRRIDSGMKYSPVFGRYSFLESHSLGKVITVGDDVVITKRNTDRTVFDWPGLST